MRLAVVALATALSLFAAGRAGAEAPVLRSIDLPAYEDHPTYNWSLPTSGKGAVRSEFAETATGSDVNNDGYFFQRSLVEYNPLDRTATSFTDTFEYTPGTYFVHIAGHDPKCVGGVCEQIQFSNVLSFDVVKPPPPGGGTVDRLAPLQTLSFASVQDIDKLKVTTRTTEAGTVSAGGAVAASGASKAYRLKGISKPVAANVRTTLRLKLSKRNLKAVKRALRKHRRMKARVTVTAADSAKNKRSAKVAIGLMDS
jgi:hypothetical protein